MGTHPIFESDFDCLTEHKMSNQWGYMNPDTTYVKKRDETKSLGLLEVKKSDSESDNDSSDDQKHSMMTEMAKFLDDVEKDEVVSKQRKEARKKEEEKLARVEPNRWGPWIEYFDKDTKHPYYFNMETKETVWKLSDSTKRKYETRESKSRSRSSTPPPKRRRQRQQQQKQQRDKSPDDQLRQKTPYFEAAIQTYGRTHAHRLISG